MKKTVSINIKGMNFLIEEDAYELLQDYMDRLNHGLRNEKGNKEIVEDIELRVAELCSSKLTEKKQVVELEDIQSILETLGDPSQFIDEDATTSETFSKESHHSTNAKSKERRLFRDIDNSTIAGVCAGIANFFSIDVVIIRAIFVVMFIFGGFGLPLYIILWIIVPKANSTIDKLRMRGKAVTVESVKEEIESAAQRLKNDSKSFANRIRKDDTVNKRFSSIGRLINVAFGSGLILFGLFWLLMLLIFGVGGLQFIPVESDNGFLSISEFGELILANDSAVHWVWIGALMVALSGILFILLLGVKIVFRIRNKWSKMTFSFLFLMGFIGTVICIFIGAKTGRDLINEGKIERLIGSVQCEQLIVQTHSSSTLKSGEYDIKTNDDFDFIGIQGDNIQESGIHFEYRLSKDSLFHIRQNLLARGYSRKIAVKKAENIQHSASLDSTILNVNTHYIFPKKDKLRDQEVYIIIEIPEGKSIKINNQIIRSTDRLNQIIYGYIPGIPFSMNQSQIRPSMCFLYLYRSCDQIKT